MPALVAALGRLLLWAGGSIVGKILLGLGVGVVAYSGVDTITSAFLSYVNAQLGSVDPIYLQAADALGFRVGLQFIMSAYVARFGTQTAYRIALRRAAA